MKLNQVTVPTLNVKKAIPFYELLGLKLIVKSAHYVRFVCPDGNATFSVHQVDKLQAGKGVTVYFECDNLDEKVNILLSQGVEFIEEPNDKDWLWREAHLNDTDGNHIILYLAGENRLNPPWKIK